MNRRDALKSLLAAPPATGLAFVSEQGEVLPIASVNVLQLQKDDLVVASFKGEMHPATAERLRQHLESLFPGGQKVLVMTKGIKLSVVRP